ncbi:MAG: hypothetical protein Q4F25_00600 [Eubacteriales bacterium]|nr:hypothetical protein [Eubacteriales bacterium]
MGRRRSRRGSEEINLTPLLDVLFSILCIVMLINTQNEHNMQQSAEESRAQVTEMEGRISNLEEENSILKSEVSRRDKIQDSSKRYESGAVIVTLINEAEGGDHILKVYTGQTTPEEEFRLGTDRTDYIRQHMNAIISEIVEGVKDHPVFIVFHCDAGNIYRNEEFKPIREALEYQRKYRKEVFYQIIEE